MKVTVMYRPTGTGRRWRVLTPAIEIADSCPKCGEPRGKPAPFPFYEDGQWPLVDLWTNPCGHVDRYEDCIKEAMELARYTAPGGAQEGSDGK